MKVYPHRALVSRLATWICGLVLVLTCGAFPPAPHHLVFGIVRNELGSPILLRGAEILLEVEGVVLARSVVTQVEAGVNYRLVIPMDSGATADLYKPTALRPASPFRMRVRIAGTTYLPIEMVGISRLTARAGESTRVDLTLGEDSDGDGLPDAWERNLIAASRLGKTLGDIRPGDDTDADGLSNLNEYLAGTYAFDPGNGFTLDIRSVENEGAVLEFTAVRDRTYTLHCSTDMIRWVEVPFLVVAGGGETLRSYTAREVRPMKVKPVLNGLDPAGPGVFFKLLVR